MILFSREFCLQTLMFIILSIINLRDKKHGTNRAKFKCWIIFHSPSTSLLCTDFLSAFLFLYAVHQKKNCFFFSTSLVVVVVFFVLFCFIYFFFTFFLASLIMYNIILKYKYEVPVSRFSFSYYSIEELFTLHIFWGFEISFY